MQSVHLNARDFRSVTAQLTAMQAGVLLKMVLWQVTEELPLPADHDRLCLLAGITGRWEKNAARTVLKSHGSLSENGWWIALGRQSLEIGADAFKREQEIRGGNALRQATFKRYRAECLKALRAGGVSLPRTTSMREIAATATRYGIELPVRTGNAGNGAGNALPGNGGNGEVTGAVTRYVSSAVSSSVPSEEPASEIAVASREPMPPFGEAAKAMRAAGLADAHPGHEVLRQLVRAGCPIERFGDIAAEAVVRGKGAAWALATLKGRRDDEARSVKTAKRDHAAEVREWAPFAALPSIPDGSQIDGMGSRGLANEVAAATPPARDFERSKRV